MFAQAQSRARFANCQPTLSDKNTVD